MVWNVTKDEITNRTIAYNPDIWPPPAPQAPPPVDRSITKYVSDWITDKNLDVKDIIQGIYDRDEQAVRNQRETEVAAGGASGLDRASLRSSWTAETRSGCSANHPDARACSGGHRIVDFGNRAIRRHQRGERPPAARRHPCLDYRGDGGQRAVGAERRRHRGLPRRVDGGLRGQGSRRR